MIELDILDTLTEDTCVAGPVTKDFAGLILRAVNAYRKIPGHDPLIPCIIEGCIMTGDLDSLDSGDLQIVFTGAGLHHNCVVVDPSLED